MSMRALITGSGKKPMNLTVKLTFIEGVGAARGHEPSDVVVRCRMNNHYFARGIAAAAIAVLGQSLAGDAGHALVGLAG